MCGFRPGQIGRPGLIKAVIGAASALLLSACAMLPLDQSYSGPVQRPEYFEEYYTKGSSYREISNEVLRHEDKFTVERISFNTDHGPVKIDYFRREEKSEDLIFVFPLLGGKNVIADYFAEYFSKHGYDTAIVHRSEEFKKPENIDRLEELFKENVIRDRIAIDFFERVHGKKNFGSFGISRGAINVAMTAGVDPRLKYNVMAMGGTDLVNIFKKSDQKRIKKYTEQVMAQKQITRDQFFTFLEETLRTDPKYLAPYMDARNTLLILSLLDKTVPIKYGLKLRTQVGNPQTVLVTGTHYTSILYTQYINTFLPVKDLWVLPPDYVETQALTFYDKSFKKKGKSLKALTYEVIQIPFGIIAQIADTIF